MVLGQRFGELFELVGKAHVEHLVGLVHDEEFDLRQIEGAAVQMVERAARRGDHGVHAAL